MDDVAVLIATSHHVIPVANVHTGGDQGNGGTRGLLHHGGGSGGDRGGLRQRGDGEGEAQATGKDKRERHQENNGQRVPNVPGGVVGHFVEVCGHEGHQRGDIEGNILGTTNDGDRGGSIR